MPAVPHFVRLVALVLLPFAIAPTRGWAQDEDDDPGDAGSRRRRPAVGVTLGVEGYGVAIGDVPRVRGLRINWRDERLRRVDGINLTLWAPRDAGGEINGLAIGLAAPSADRIRGIAVGGAAVVGGEELSGINLAGIAGVSGGDMRGVNVAGAAVVAEGRLDGISVGGLAAVTQGGARGLTAGGLAVVSERDMTGATIGGLAVVSQGDLRWLSAGGLAVVAEGAATGANLGGLAVVAQGTLRGATVGGLAAVTEGDALGVNFGGLGLVAQGDMSGLNLAGAGAVAQGRIRGISVGGIGVVSQEEIAGLTIAGAGIVSQGPVRWVALTAGAVDARSSTVSGVAVGGYYVRALAVHGGAAALWRVRTRDLTGVSVAAFNDVRGPQRGLSVGVVNRARTLHGVQLGLLNHVSENPPLLRWMPVANASFAR